MKALETVNWLVALMTLIALLFGTYFVLEARHASKKEMVQLKSKELDRDINRNSKIRHHYDMLQTERNLSKAEESRLKYIEEELERQYEEQAELRQAEDSL